MNTVSDFPTGDSGSDPFQGMPPMLRDLFKMIQQSGPVQWDAARQLANSIATNGESEPNVDPLERMKIEQLARVAELKVADVTGLTPSTTGSGITLVPCNRSTWVQRTLDDYKPYFSRLADSLADANRDAGPAVEPDSGDPFAWMGPLMNMLGPTMLGLTSGSMVGHLAQRAFGQYDLPLPRPANDELLVLVSNLDAFGEEWSLAGDDLRLWVCLHEIAHHTVLNLPHVRSRLEQLLLDYLGAFDVQSGGLEERLSNLELSDSSGMPGMQGMQELMNDPEWLLGAIKSPRQAELQPQLAALASAVEGYVDWVMDEAGTGLISSYGMVTEALRRRRVEAASSDRFVEQLFGLELTQKEYDRGLSFIRGIAERAGKQGVSRLWRSERELPTPAEVDAPGLWLARIDLPVE
jgi:putative hydrolase